jgi:hypothetical protein
VRTTDRKDRALDLGIQAPDEVGLRHRANAPAMVAGLTGMLGHTVMRESPHVMARHARKDLSVPNAPAPVGVLVMALLGVVLVRIRHAVKVDLGTLKQGKDGLEPVDLVAVAPAAAGQVKVAQSALVVHAVMRLDETVKSLGSSGVVVGRVLIGKRDPGLHAIETKDPTVMRHHTTMIHRSTPMPCPVSLTVQPGAN